LIIFGGQAFSLLGSAAVNFALVWWLTVETGSATILAAASIAAVLPQALVGLVAGPFVDRWDRRLTMIVADLFIASMSVLLMVAFALHAAGVGIVMAAIAARSVGAAFHTPASQAAVPMYVPPEQLLRVSGWSFFLSSGVAMAGPVLGAFLMGVAPISVVIAVDVAGAVLAAGSLVLVRIPHPEQASGRQDVGLFGEFVEGWRELRWHRGLFHMTLLLTVVTLLYMPINALFPLMTFGHFGGDAFDASVIELAFGAGMLVASLGIGAVAARSSATWLIAVGLLLAGLTIGGSGLLPSSAFWAFAGLSVAMGFSVPLFGAPLNAMFQRLIDPAKLGRVMSLYMTMALFMSVPGLLIAGPFAQRIGVDVWFAVTGLLVVGAGLLVRLLPSVRRLDCAEPRLTPAEAPSATAG
jgi:DHA3 family macrolide efflux protein-like MFS transporter